MNARIYQINDQWEDHSYPDWFEKSLTAFADDAPSSDPDDYDYVQIVPQSHYRAYWQGNAGAQAFRHRETGWTFPDCCRQAGGCPEMWHRTKCHQLEISDDSPVWDYVVDW